MLTQKEKDIVIACVEHWTVNAKNRFLEGGKAYPGMPCIWDDGTAIKTTWKDCPMCQEYLLKDYNCDRCLFKTVLNSRCDKAGGADFAGNPTLETCNKFMDNFYKILGDK